MNPSPDASVYNLKAVVHETGLKPDTIRAWERRYGLPEPRRTESGHRLYSLNDINMLKWLVARQEQGVSISRAVELWRRLADANINPSEATAKEVRPPAPSIGGIQSDPGAGQLTRLRRTWLNACLNFDEQAAERVVAEAFARFSVEVVCTELLQQGLVILGDGWYEGNITVQQEHFASELATRRLETLLSVTPPPTRPGRILVGCPPGERHIFGPMLLTLFVRRHGWEVIFLGGDVPLTNLIATTRITRPQLVVMIAQQLTTAAALLELGQVLLNELLPLAVGGRIFVAAPELRQRIPGHYLGDTIAGAMQTVETLMALPRTQPAQVLASHHYHEALHHFRRSLPNIEADVWQRLSESRFAPEDLTVATSQLGANIAAALALGNIEFLRPQLQWAEKLVTTHRHQHESQFSTYVSAYLVAVEQQLGERGVLISHWLRTALNGSHSPAAIAPLDERK